MAQVLEPRAEIEGQAITLLTVGRYHILMIPSKADPRWAALVKGEVNHRFSSAAASMLFFCLRSKMKSDNSTANLQQCVDEAFVFFTKYERTLQQDIKAIFN